jgi:hypothetical protein
MPNWQALAKARELDIPEDAIARIAPALDQLHADFAPLLARLPHTVEPAVTLSESAVFGSLAPESAAPESAAPEK